MSPSTIAVTGATGQQGGAVARTLLERGANVVAVVRDPGKDTARALAEAGAELRQADLTDLDAVTSAVRGVDAAFVMATMTGPDGTDGEIRVGTTVADAVAAAGVGFAVYSSVGGAERHTGVPHFESKRRVEEHVEALGLPATFVRPVFFMENLTPTLEDGTTVLRMPMPGDVPVQMVAVDDIGTVAAAVLLDPSRVPGGAVEIAGDEVTGEQAAAVLGAAAGTPARYEALPVEVLDDPDLAAMFTWFVESRPAYRADLALTRELAPQVQDLATWAARSAGVRRRVAT